MDFASFFSPACSFLGFFCVIGFPPFLLGRAGEGKGILSIYLFISGSPSFSVRFFEELSFGGVATTLMSHLHFSVNTSRCGGRPHGVAQGQRNMLLQKQTYFGLLDLPSQLLYFPKPAQARKTLHPSKYWRLIHPSQRLVSISPRVAD